MLVPEADLPFRHQTEQKQKQKVPSLPNHRRHMKKYDDHDNPDDNDRTSRTHLAVASAGPEDRQGDWQQLQDYIRFRQEYHRPSRRQWQETDDDFEAGYGQPSYDDNR
eukprot:TRINITY_DN90613_c0_g1_i1.p2 TRINITY_DN90613_c0_g1~~TRINITY_DN90613_c0_g1_i1.p2  ORF type:complete len:108 (-),score=16.03 TRINITY_DN90613_c0_g1_i1:60-383(-)